MTPDLHVEWRPYDFRVTVYEEDLANMNDEDSAEQMSTPEPDLSEILSAPTPEAAFQHFGDRVVCAFF